MVVGGMATGSLQCNDADAMQMNRPFSTAVPLRRSVICPKWQNACRPAAALCMCVCVYVCVCVCAVTESLTRGLCPMLKIANVV